MTEMPDLPRQVTAEALSTALVTAVVCGSAAMGARLTEDGGQQILAAAVVTAAALLVLISILGPVSGAHMNPAVTLVFALRGEIAVSAALAFAAAQTVGALAGAALAHAMFDLPLWQPSSIAQETPAMWLSEGIATFGLVLTILGAIAARAPVAGLVGAYIAAAYWFTASTSFANPAQTLARGFTTTGASVQIADLPAFLATQLAGALLAAALDGWLFGKGKPPARAHGG